MEELQKAKPKRQISQNARPTGKLSEWTEADQRKLDEELRQAEREKEKQASKETE